MNEVQYISKEKLKELTEELECLKTEKRAEIAEALELARGFGDLSENAEYQEARRLQAETEARIKELEYIISNAKVVHKSKKHDKVTVGSTVILTKKGDKSKITYEIVGCTEADILNNKISNESPLGEALMGKAKGESFVFETPAGEVEYKIVDIK